MMSNDNSNEDSPTHPIVFYNYGKGDYIPRPGSLLAVAPIVKERIIHINKSAGRIHREPSDAKIHYKIHHLSHTLTNAHFAFEYGKNPPLVDALNNPMHFFMTGRVATSSLHTGHVMDYGKHPVLAELNIKTYQVNAFHALLRGLAEKVGGAGNGQHHVSVLVEDGAIHFSTFYNIERDKQIPIHNALWESGDFDFYTFEKEPKLMNELHPGSSVIVGFTVRLFDAKEHKNCVGFTPEFVCLLCEDFDAEAEAEEDEERCSEPVY
ncbi:hypothetical protein BDR26DRAFT_862243 [Obelidium mucronatum]|nr:hypothetical protein BDR26DRAFT_862243 [Obelidium mucronatum]